MKLQLIAAVVAALGNPASADAQQIGVAVAKAKKKVQTYVVRRGDLYRSNKLQLSRKDIECLVRNTYFEAGVETLEGKIAVSQVVLKRLQEQYRGATSVCKVVYSRSQFSWTKDRANRTAKLSGPLWEASKDAVQQFVNGMRVKGVEDAFCYHATYIKKPKEFGDAPLLLQIGQHKFYDKPTADVAKTFSLFSFTFAAL